MRSVFEFIWKVWLQKHSISTKDSAEYRAEISTSGSTIHNKDIARIIIDEGSENQYETILNIINRRDGIVMKHVANGGAVQDRCLHIAPHLLGIWKDTDTKLNPKIHKITIDVRPTVEFRSILKKVRIDLLGIKGHGSQIDLVTDVSTRRTDGHITSGEDIIISGAKIKIAPADASDVGIFLQNNSTAEIYKLQNRLIENKPSVVIARLPALPSGEYSLSLATRYSHGGRNKPLKTSRIITYNQTLNVE
ncbi:MAG: DUF4469 domain-containing protein [Prevotellaceae bacterium]|jgi:hypothetical protein|nr:DUF4469 domain-containing protein [Prevotellaceae bacterium]